MNPIASSLFALALCFSVTWAIAMPESRKSQQSLEHLVAEQRSHLGLVGLGVMVMRDGEVIASAVAGERKHRSGVHPTDQDKWHIGSITKSVTATMIARMVERGELNWDTTIGDVLGDSFDVSESWRSITIAQLLTHTSGAPSSFRPPFSYLFRTYHEGAELSEARRTLVEKFIKKNPITPAGSQFAYSNGGFLIAGVMAEKLTGLSWEDLIRREIFAPLDLKTGGFGHPQDPKNELGQPKGHKKRLGFMHTTDDDPVNLIGPAGSIHMSMEDLLKYANDHLLGEAGGGKLLKAETYQKLHTPVLDNYAFGWVISSTEEWANGPVIWHNGSNGYWYALLAIVPSSNTVIAITSNDGRLASASDMGWPLLEKLADLTK